MLGKDVIKHGQEKKPYSSTVNLISYAWSVFTYGIMGLFESPINFYKWFIILLVVGGLFMLIPGKPTKHNGFASVIATAGIVFIYYKAGMFDKFFALINF